MSIFRSVSQKNTVLTISVSHGDTESFRSPLFLSLTLKPVCGDVSGLLTSEKTACTPMPIRFFWGGVPVQAALLLYEAGKRVRVLMGGDFSTSLRRQKGTVHRAY